jgi:CheY-specific phosphatase CheX
MGSPARNRRTLNECGFIARYGQCVPWWANLGKEVQSMAIELDESSIIKANFQFWEQMLAMKLDPLPCADQFCLESGHALGTVSLSGAWNGQVEIRMDEGLTNTATAAMLMQPVEAVVEADALDATREIANMIAGVIKSSLPRPCVMTVPEAAIKLEQFCGQMRNEHSVAVIFQHAAGTMMVRVQMLEPAL